MIANDIPVMRKRIDHFFKYLPGDLFAQRVALHAEYALSDAPVPFADRLKLSYKAVKPGERWGNDWQSAWFHISGTVPAEFAGKELALIFNVGGEALVFDENGSPVYGLSGASHFNPTFKKERMVLGRNFRAGDHLDFWIECAANHLFGLYQDDFPRLDTTHPQGEFVGIVDQIDLVVFDRELWSFILDFQIAVQLLDNAGDNTLRGKKINHVLNCAIDAYNRSSDNAAAARAEMRKILDLPATASALTAIAVGHAHIDVGWLWPVRESIRKAARTFSSQLALMDKYPDYVFGASQAQLYWFVKEFYPTLFERIKQRVAEGRWEVQGGMWVEADCNLISGESMVRQFMHGKNFFMDEFGFDVKNLWLPDVFGYSATLPQILKKSGCDSFLTQKLSWSQINKFPHQTFRWTGVDGSTVITHFPPENSYNSLQEPTLLAKAENEFVENDVCEQFMSLYGIGDGGGGPYEEIVERGLRMRNLEGVPHVKFGRADQFFEALSKQADQLKEYRGELYLEFHRGTFTTQSRTKRNNRKSEQMLALTEFLNAALADLKDYPSQELDQLWKTLLLNQFHDIIPGSSIDLVYKTTEKEHAELLQKCAELLSRAAAKLFCADEQSMVAVNSLSVPFCGAVELPERWNGCTVTDSEGKALPVQCENGRSVVLLNLPGSSFVTLYRATNAPAAAQVASGKLILENELIRYEFDADGRVLSAYDKSAGREVLSAPGNTLKLYHDHPVSFEAWEVEPYYKREFYADFTAAAPAVRTVGSVRSTIDFTLKGSQSTLRQKAILRAGSKRLDFETVVDWQEERKMLRTAFPVTIQAAKANFDIQYAFIDRNAHDNNSWDCAQFEVCAQRYADLSDYRYGVALLNDCKYGYRVKDSEFSLCLLRSPKYPDFNADRGRQCFTYSLLPHEGTLIESTVMAEAACLNRAPFLADGFRQENVGSVCAVESGNGVSLEIVKKAEKRDCRVIRLVETRGQESSAVLYFRDAATLVETNLLEWTEGAEVPVRDHRVSLTLKPFEIRTYLVK